MDGNIFVTLPFDGFQWNKKGQLWHSQRDIGGTVAVGLPVVTLNKKRHSLAGRRLIFQ